MRKGKKPILPAVLCLAACLCSCAGPRAVRDGASPPTAPADQPCAHLRSPADAPAGDRIAWRQRADRMAGRLRDKLAQMPARVQDGLETAADSDVVTCLLPVIAVAGFVGALLSGCACSGIGWGAPASATP